MKYTRKFSTPFLFLFLMILPLANITTAGGKTTSQLKVTSVPKNLGAHPFYKKYLDAGGIAILSSENVRDEALITAKTIVEEMLAKVPDVKKAMVDKKSRILIIGEKEEVCDLPEYADICNNEENIKFWNWRARGFGGDPEGDCSASCGEENVLALAGDRYEGESILVHEFAHLVHSVGLCGVDKKFNDKLQAMYLKAKSKGLWAKTYAMENKEEYFAETVQSFLNTNRYSEQPNGIHGPIDTREKLKKYDPEMYKFLTKYFYEDRELSLYNNSPDRSYWYNSPGAGNPLIPGYFADPTVMKFDDTYYLYATTDGTGLGTGPSQVWTSKDFVNWSISPMNWPQTEKIWAPDVFKAKDNKYYMYYSVPCMIYSGVSDSPKGPWKNVFGQDDKILIPDRFVQGAITLDAQTFVDDDGSVYMYWGTWGIYKGFGCGAGKLNPDMKTFSDTVLIPNTQIKDFFEGPFVFKRNGIYYFTYSSGSCHDHTYRVQYDMSKNGPFGPFEFQDNNPILETSKDKTIQGPGHHSIIKEGEDYYIVYHRHNIPKSNRGFNRQVCADKLTFDKDGKIMKVQASHKGIGYLQKNTNPYTDIAKDKRVRASSYYNNDFIARYVTDNNNATLWKAASCTKDEWIEVDLTAVMPVKRIWTQFEYATSFYQYLIETSVDGKKWEIFADRRKNTFAGSPMIDLGNTQARYVKLTVTGNEKSGLFPAIWNIKVFTENNDAFVQNEERFNGQPLVAAEKSKGLIFEINADLYKENDLLEEIKLTNKVDGIFKSVAGKLPVKSILNKKAFGFDGSQHFKSDFSLPSNMSGNTPYTIMAWINSPNAKEFEYLLDLNDAWGEIEKVIFGYGTNHERGIIMHHGSFEDQGLKSTSLKEEWFHLTVSFDGYLEKIYLNGKKVSEKNIFLRLSQGKTVNLGTKFDRENPFRGNLNSLSLYDCSLDEKKIFELYDKTKQ